MRTIFIHRLFALFQSYFEFYARINFFIKKIVRCFASQKQLRKLVAAGEIPDRAYAYIAVVHSR